MPSVPARIPFAWRIPLDEAGASRRPTGRSELPGRPTRVLVIGDSQSLQRTRSRCPRVVIPSFVNTLRRWYSTVRGLMNPFATIIAAAEDKEPLARADQSDGSDSASYHRAARFWIVSSLVASDPLGALRLPS